MTDENLIGKKDLLLILGHDKSMIRQDVEAALRQLTRFPLVDQDREAAILGHVAVEQWLIESESRALLINGNSRRHETISPASVICAMLVHIFTDTPPIVTLYWFCGSHTDEFDGNALSMMRSLICQLLSRTSSFDSGSELQHNIDIQDLGRLLDLFTDLLRRLPAGTAVVCIIDGISYYEDSHKRKDTCRSIRRIVRLLKEKVPILKLLITSATRTRHIHQEPNIAKHMTVVEIPHHVDGAKQGFDHHTIVSSTERRVRKLSVSLGAGTERTT